MSKQIQSITLLGGRSTDLEEFHVDCAKEIKSLFEGHHARSLQRLKILTILDKIKRSTDAAIENLGDLDLFADSDLADEKTKIAEKNLLDLLNCAGELYCESIEINQRRNNR